MSSISFAPVRSAFAAGCCNFLWRLKRGFGRKGLRRGPDTENVCWQTKIRRLTVIFPAIINYPDNKTRILTMDVCCLCQFTRRYPQATSSRMQNFQGVAEKRRKNYQKWAESGKDSKCWSCLGRTIFQLNHFLTISSQGHVRYSKRASRTLEQKSQRADSLGSGTGFIL